MKKMLNNLLIVLLISLTSATWAKSKLASESQNKTNYQIYIIQLINAPLTTYSGEIKGLEATKKTQNSLQHQPASHLKFDIKSKASLAYKSFLVDQQEHSLSILSSAIKRSVSLKYRYLNVLNGFAINLTPTEASLAAKLPQVKSIELAPQHKIQTDRGPLLIQAPSAWDGTATGLPVKGEGMLVAIIDTGIRHAHQSFAEVSPSDGYVHINPLGNGVFLGYCATTAGFCNNKLIGAYNFADDVTDPEDENGHGTHVASTAAGNTLTFDLASGNGFNLTGVAPRANIIAYRIADSEGTASPGASVAAIDQAVANGVDVINYSFGGDAFDPWLSSDSIAFRNARAVGIIVITSAGNDGPNPETIGSPADAPWLTSVAASTHDRGAFPAKTLSNMSGGTGTPPATINGRSLTGEVTASIVYAGDFSNGDTNPEQCLTPFPANTFNGQIVICDRGEIARVQKAINVAAGGAGGYVLANIQGGSSFLADDIYVVPGIHIEANDGDTLKLWLSGGANHIATINGTSGPIGVDPAAADIVADFSSRGPNPTASGVLKPSVAAPGVSIFAAGIEVDYTFLQGTSMASPHVAGAAALIKQSKPNWTAGQIHSALVSTANTALVKEDTVTPADPFDIGGGRVDLNTALNAGLLLDETEANFVAANPTSGGNPKTLNLPSMADHDCSVICTWSREVTAAVTGSWTASFIVDSGLTLDVTPASFSLSQNESQTLSITADISGVDGQWLFGQLLLTPDDNNISTSHFPVAAQVNNSSLPAQVSIDSQRNSGQHLFSNITTLAAPLLQAEGFLSMANPVQKSLEADSDNSSAFDDLTDGIAIELVNVAAGSQLVFAETSNSSAEDLDLFVGFDANDDGQAQESELLESSTSPNANEQILISQPMAGTYWVLVQNWSGAATGEDTYTSVSGVVGVTASSNIIVNLPSASDGITAFNIAMNFNQINTGQYFGMMALGSGLATGDLGVTAFVINRVADDVSISASPSSVAADATVSVTVTITPDTNEQRNYISSINIPTGLSVNSASITNGASLSGSQISWDATVNGGTTSFTFNAVVNTSLAGQTINLSVDHDVNIPNAKQETSSTSFNVLSQNTNGGNTGGGGGSLFWLLLIGGPLLFFKIK